MRSDRFEFPSAAGHRLSARLDRPDGSAVATALFAHCFTCGKDVLAAARIARRLAALGIATLRFDFTGLGGSGGEFGNSTFRANLDDLVAAAAELRRVAMAPALLIGHSLGGAAMLAATGRIPEAGAVATIAAPYDPAHALRLFADALPAIEAAGEAEVEIAGRRFRIGRALVDDLRAQRQADRIAGLGRALMVMHAPGDAIVGVDNAAQIFAMARHPKSFVSLDDADHLLSRASDAEYAADVLAAWASRYLRAGALPAGMGAVRPVAGHAVVVRETGRGRFQQEVRLGPHTLMADEPVGAGGLDSGPNPYDLLLASLGACSAMTMRLYAERKGWPLGPMTVALDHSKVHAADCADCETREGRIDEIHKLVALEGPLEDAQRARILEIADRCPVHSTLLSELKIRTALAAPGAEGPGPAAGAA